MQCLFISIILVDIRQELDRDMQGLDDYNRFLQRKTAPKAKDEVVKDRSLAKKTLGPEPGVRYTIENGVTRPIFPEAVEEEEIGEPVLSLVVEPDVKPIARTIAPPRIPLAAMKPSRRPQMPMPAVATESPIIPCWERLPAHIRLIAGLIEPDEANLYDDEARGAERQKLIESLLNPNVTLDEVAVLLGVSSATVRRYTTKGILPCQRTVGQQRRFRLADVLAFLERNGGARG
jgi:excisionase family DNA binding protein